MVPGFLDLKTHVGKVGINVEKHLVALIKSRDGYRWRGFRVAVGSQGPYARSDGKWQRPEPALCSYSSQTQLGILRRKQVAWGPYATHSHVFIVFVCFFVS